MVIAVLVQPLEKVPVQQDASSSDLSQCPTPLPSTIVCFDQSEDACTGELLRAWGVDMEHWTKAWKACLSFVLAACAWPCAVGNQEVFAQSPRRRGLSVCVRVWRDVRLVFSKLLATCLQFSLFAVSNMFAAFFWRHVRSHFLIALVL